MSAITKHAYCLFSSTDRETSFPIAISSEMDFMAKAILRYYLHISSSQELPNHILSFKLNSFLMRHPRLFPGLENSRAEQIIIPSEETLSSPEVDSPSQCRSKINGQLSEALC